MEFFRLAIDCPSCHTSPSIRVPLAEIQLHLRADPESIVQSYKCHRPDCRTTYVITARAFQHVRLDRTRTFVSGSAPRR